MKGKKRGQLLSNARSESRHEGMPRVLKHAKHAFTLIDLLLCRLTPSESPTLVWCPLEEMVVVSAVYRKRQAYLDRKRLTTGTCRSARALQVWRSPWSRRGGVSYAGTNE